ncbi:hypothetical protein niasHT_026936 [Heterodera trifolii]|uniref:Uncharacterized protein n=1 Tax=Heterodera trifolii TaxID=157864 RepID=A0ABD2KRB9_9BILA
MSDFQQAANVRAANVRTANVLTRSVLLYGSIPKSAFRFGTFEFLKGHAVDERGNLSPFMRLACGLGAGISEAIFNIGKAALPWFFKGQKQASWSCEPSKSAGNSTCARVVE